MLVTRPGTNDCASSSTVPSPNAASAARRLVVASADGGVHSTACTANSDAWTTLSAKGSNHSGIQVGVGARSLSGARSRTVTNTAQAQPHPCFRAADIAADLNTGGAATQEPTRASWDSVRPR